MVDDESLSDHNYICFSVADSVFTAGSVPYERPRFIGSRPRWNYTKLDTEILTEALEWYGVQGNSVDVDAVIDRSALEYASWIGCAVTRACDMAAPRTGRPARRRNSYWWGPRLAELRRRCIRAKRALTKCNSRLRRRTHGSMDIPDDDRRTELGRIYKLARKELREAIRLAKLNAWNELLASVEADIWGRPYLLVLGRLRRSSPCLTESLDIDTLNGLMDSLFPAGEADVTRELGGPGWSNDLAIRPAETLAAVMRKRNSNTAPGLDGVRSVIWRRAPRPMILRLTECFSACLRDGVFPDTWKRAGLVLIPKAGKSVDGRPLKVRPICLLSVTGKIFERVIAARMLSWMEEHPSAGFSNNQFGFRQGRSTCDALLRLTSIVEESIADRGVVVAVSLDICNAFNSLPHKQIMRALRAKGFPVYLRNIIRDYLSGRVVEFSVAGGRVMERVVRAGVPQGSVLGPLLWNLTYASVLGTRLWPGCHILGYADDTLIVASANSVDTAGIWATMQTAAVVSRIRRIGLAIAAEKTDAILFHGRRRPSHFPVIRVEHESIEVGRTLKYLGVVLDSRLNFGDHFSYVAAKASKVACSLGRLMPNLRGPSESKRRLYSAVVLSVLMYGSPVWHNAMYPVSAAYRRRQAPMLRVQRFIALRVIAAYRSVSLEAATLLACMPPMYLLAGFYRRTYVRIRDLKTHNNWTPEADKEIRVMERSLLNRQWQIHVGRHGLSGARVRLAIKPVFMDWIARDKKMGLGFHLTQLITGHGCFSDYLFRIGREGQIMCYHCGLGTDSAQHTLEECWSWTVERAELRLVVGPDLSLPALIRRMLASNDCWRAIASFADVVMLCKEDAERMRRNNNDASGSGSDSGSVRSMSGSDRSMTDS